MQALSHFGYDDTAVMDIKGIKVGLVGIYELKDHLGREQQLKDNIAKGQSRWRRAYHCDLPLGQ